MDTDRLLTEQEWSEACAAMPGGSKCSDCRIALCAKQDAKTAALVQVATLRAVGEALEKQLYIPEGARTAIVVLTVADVEALCNGQWPAGWEKE